ncbi:MAG: hypothetical protein U1D55_11200 [Phycisphaerae bacterium]
MPARHTSSLSPPQRELLALFQRLNFGKIEQLIVRNGQPVFEPLPRIVREHKFGGENGPRPECALAEFSLKPQARELFDALADMRDGVIERIEIQRGLPFRMLVLETAAR